MQLLECPLILPDPSAQHGPYILKGYMSQYTSPSVTNLKEHYNISYKNANQRDKHSGKLKIYYTLSKRHTSNRGSMATYALGSWNASLILDPTWSIKDKKFVLIIQTKLAGVEK